MSNMDYKTERQGVYKTTKGQFSYLINKDNDALAAYKRRKQKSRDLNTALEEIDYIKSELSEIKTLLRKMVT